LTFLIGVMGTTPARAAELHTIRSTRTYSGDALEVARAFLQERTGRYDLHRVELVHRATLARGDYRTVRFVQQYAGLPVLGTAAAVRVSPAARVTVAAFGVSRDLTVSTTPLVSHGEVRTLLYGLVGPWAANGPLTFLLAVLPEDRGPGRLVWRVDVPTGLGGLRYLLDAHRGVLLHVRHLAIETLGRVYPISSVVTPDATDVELVYLDDASPLVLTGWDGQLIVTNYASGGSQTGIVAEQILHPSDGTDFLYDPPADPTDPTDGFAQVGLYYHLTRMRDFFADDLGVDFSQPSYSLTAVANMMEDGQPMDNAFFSEQGMGAPFDTNNLIAIGQGTTFDFADDSDVLLHEFTHYVSHVTVGFNMGQMAVNDYGLSTYSGSIDEGLADYFACTVNGDPLLGEASLVPFGSDRDLTDTSKVCPDDVFGEVHMDGEIIGSVSWTLYESFGKANADQLIWGALTLLLPYATFGDFAQGLVQTAGEMVTGGQLVAADVQTLQDALDARGLSDCFQELPIAPAAPRTINMFGLDLLGGMMGGSCQDARDYGIQLSSMFHFRATPEPTDEGVRLSVQLALEEAGDLLWKIFARAGEHVTFGSGGGFMPEVLDYDFQTSWLDTTTGELVIDDRSDPPFDSGQTYHFVVVHQNCPSSQAVITVEPAQASGDPDAGVDGGVDGDASVSADASDTDGGGKNLPLPLPLLLPLLLLVWSLIWRRRRLC
jgi:hypothetical protein